MSAKPGTAAWKREYQSIIIGVVSSTKTVGRIYVQNDGTMVNDNIKHNPGNRQRIHEAMVVFGFRHAREFMIFGESPGKEYVEQLKQKIEQGED